MMAGAFSYWFGGWSATTALLLFLIFNHLVGEDYLTKRYEAFGLDYLTPPAEYSIEALQKLNDLCCVSSQTQLLVQQMLSEVSNDGISWTSKFLEENHGRLRVRGDAWQACLEECRIPYLKATAGLFCWMDFREFLPMEGTDDERERALYLELMNEYGLLFTPGLSMKNEHPGFFRCVFTAASDDEFALGMSRLRKFVEAKRG